MKKRFRFPKWTVISITIIMVVLLGLTFILFEESACRRMLLLTQAIALLLQVFLNVINWRSHQKIVILATLFISATIAASVIWRFITFHLICG